MSSEPVAWDRFVRYIAQGTDQDIRYGDPIISGSDVDLIAQIAEEGKLEVKRLHGNDPLSATPTGEIDKVARLLGPLEPAHVPIIRCIGLNYKTHSMYRIGTLVGEAPDLTDSKFSRPDGRFQRVQRFLLSQGQPLRITARTSQFLVSHRSNAITRVNWSLSSAKTQRT